MRPFESTVFVCPALPEPANDWAQARVAKPNFVSSLQHARGDISVYSVCKFLSTLANAIFDPPPHPKIPGHAPLEFMFSFYTLFPGCDDCGKAVESKHPEITGQPARAFPYCDACSVIRYPNLRTKTEAELLAEKMQIAEDKKAEKERWKAIRGLTLKKVSIRPRKIGRKKRSEADEKQLYELEMQRKRTEERQKIVTEKNLEDELLRSLRGEK